MLDRIAAAMPEATRAQFFRERDRTSDPMKLLIYKLLERDNLAPQDARLLVHGIAGYYYYQTDWRMVCAQ